MRKTLLLIFLILLTFSSFKKPSQIDINLLYKTWIFTITENKPYPIFHYKVSDSIKDYPAYKFLKSGKLIVRQNLTLCPVGVTKMKYETVLGSWKFNTDSVIQLKYKSLGKERVHRYKITLLNEEELALSVKTK